MVFVVDTPGAKISLRHEHIEVRDQDDLFIGRAELTHLDELILVGPIGITGPVLEALVRHAVDLFYVASDGQPAARLVPDGSTLPELRLSQYDLFMNQERRLKIAQSLVLGKMINGVRLLARAQRTATANADLSQISSASDLVARAHNLDTLRGAEGVAAHRYFSALAGVVPAKWEFKARRRRPPPDPFNALLSFGYVVAAQRAAMAIRTARLDLYLGILHEDREGRPSLALDLLEEFRPLIVDATAIKIVRMKMLKPTDFERTDEGGCRMSASARSVFLRALESRFAQEFMHPGTGAKVDFRKAMEIQARHLARVIRKEEAEYRPLVLR